jgi:hypothetical protein
MSLTIFSVIGYFIVLTLSVLFAELERFTLAWIACGAMLTFNLYLVLILLGVI